MEDGNYLEISKSCSGRITILGGSDKQELTISGSDLSSTTLFPDGCQLSYEGESVSFPDDYSVALNIGGLVKIVCTGTCDAKDLQRYSCGKPVTGALVTVWQKKI